MSYLERHYTYFDQVAPQIVEALLIPFHVGGQAVGTIWVISHDANRRFDAEDLRVMNMLGQFAASTYQVLSSIKAVEASNAELAGIVWGNFHQGRKWRILAEAKVLQTAAFYVYFILLLYLIKP